MTTVDRLTVCLSVWLSSLLVKGVILDVIHHWLPVVCLGYHFKQKKRPNLLGPSFHTLNMIDRMDS